MRTKHGENMLPFNVLYKAKFAQFIDYINTHTHTSDSDVSPHFTKDL